MRCNCCFSHRCSWISLYFPPATGINVLIYLSNMIEPALPENRENPTKQCLSIQSLVDEHLGAVYRYAYRLTGTVQDAEDLTQQVFLLAQQRLEYQREADQRAGWLFAILRNLFLKMVERAVPVAASECRTELGQRRRSG